MLDVFGNEPKQFDAGTSFYYTNSGYFLLGLIIENVSGMTYQEYLDERIFQPAGLTSTYYGSSERIIPGRVQGYRTVDGTRLNAEPISMTVPYAAGALCSTAEDLCRFYQALSDGTLLEQKTFREMLTPSPLGAVTLHYCKGVMHSVLGGVEKYCHPGEINGFGSQVAFYPEDDVAIVVLANTKGSFPEQIETQIAREMLEIESPPIEHQPLAQSSANRYVGNYRFGDMTIEISTTGDSIAMAFPPRIPEPVPLVHLEGDTFCFPHDAEMFVRFSGSEDSFEKVLFNAGIVLVEGTRSD